MIYPILSVAAGSLVKIADYLEDDLKSKSLIRFAIPSFYGLIIGFLISQSPFSTIFLAALIAQMLAGKVDNMSHRLGFGLALVSLFFFGIPAIDVQLLFAFVILAFLDESELPEILSLFKEHRLFLPLGAIALASMGTWDYAIGIVLFDLGYRASNFLLGRMVKISPPARPPPSRVKKKR